MRLVIQRVLSASIRVDGAVTGAIDDGLAVLTGFGKADTSAVFTPVIEKMLNLRIFPDERGRLHHSLLETGGGLLLVPQFTLYAEIAKGRRPDFTGALAPEPAKALFELFVSRCAESLGRPVQTGVFGAMMDFALVNSGPVTITVDSDDLA